VHRRGMTCEKVQTRRCMAGPWWPLASGGVVGAVWWCWLAGCNGTHVVVIIVLPYDLRKRPKKPTKELPIRGKNTISR